MITDEQSLAGATMHGTINVPVYDDGCGPLWILQDSMGVRGVIRALTWEDAWEIGEDEMMPDADETEADWVKEYGEDYVEDPCWNEAYGFRPNGPNKVGGSAVYQKDLNGEWLNPLTPEMVEALSMTLDIRDPEPEPEPEPPTKFHHWHLTRRPTTRRGVYVVAWGGRYGARSGSFACHKRRLPAHSPY